MGMYRVSARFGNKCCVDTLLPKWFLCLGCNTIRLQFSSKIPPASKTFIVQNFTNDLCIILQWSIHSGLEFENFRKVSFRAEIFTLSNSNLKTNLKGWNHSNTLRKCFKYIKCRYSTIQIDILFKNLNCRKSGSNRPVCLWFSSTFRTF